MSNSRKYNKHRLYLFLKGFPYSLVSLLYKRDKTLCIFSSFHNNKFDSNSKYLFLYMLRNNPEYEIKFVVNDPELRNKLAIKYGNHFLDTNNHTGKMKALSASYWFVSALELPVSGFFMRFRRIVVHLGHGSPLKNVGLLEKNIKFIKKLYYYIIRTNISCSLASSESLRTVVQTFLGISRKRVLLSGQPRNDQLFEPVSNEPILNQEGFKVLYAPTWRHYSDTELFPFKDFSLDKLLAMLKERNIHMFLRIHPNFEHTVNKELLGNDYIHMFSGTAYPEISDYLNSFNCLITDYSSIFFDFILLRRPVLFLPYDLQEYEDKVGFALPFEEYTPGPKPKSLDEFLIELDNFASGFNAYISEIEKVIKRTSTIERDNCRDLLEKIL